MPADVHQELEKLREQKEVVAERARKVEGELGRLRSELVGLDRAIAQRLERLYGVKVDTAAIATALVPSSPSGPVGPVASSASLTPPAPVAPSRPPSVLDHFDRIERSKADPDQTDAAAEEAAWVKLLRTPRAQKKWRDVQMVREAIARLGGKARRRRIIEAVQLVDPHYTEKRLEALLSRDAHFKTDSSGAWYYIPGAPVLTPTEQVMFDRYRAVADAVAELGVDATFSNVLRLVQRRHNPAWIDGPQLSRTLTSGPFSKNHLGTWSVDPDARLRPSTTSARPLAARLPMTHPDSEFPLHLPREAWSRRLWTAAQRYQWKLVLTLQEVICASGGRATMSQLIERVGSWTRKKGCPRIRYLVQVDPHFKLNADGTYSFVEGPPHLGAGKAAIWEIREAIRDAVLAHGGAATRQQVCDALRARVPPIEATGQTVGYALDRGPYWRQEDGRWLHRPEQEPSLLTLDELEAAPPIPRSREDDPGEE